MIFIKHDDVLDTDMFFKSLFHLRKIFMGTEQKMDLATKPLNLIFYYKIRIGVFMSVPGKAGINKLDNPA